MAEVDLDRLAAAYPLRHEAAARARAAETAAWAGIGAGSLVVDVGGGLGAAAEVMAACGSGAVVVDPSPAMVAGACRRPGVHAVRGRGEAMPVADGAADLVYFHLSLHHGDGRAMLEEAARVSVGGGGVAVWTMDARRIAEGFLARWFPSVVEIDLVRFASAGSVIRWMEEAGLERIEHASRSEPVRRTAGDWERAVRAGFVSTLHLLDPAEVDAGLDSFRSAHPEPGAPIEYTLELLSVRGRRA